jgi:hypothetical protein
VAADGTAYVLLSAAPWIVHVDAKGGVTPLQIRDDLSWATKIAVDGAGLILVGTTAATPTFVQVERFDLTGTLKVSAQLTLVADTVLVGVAVSRGQVFVAYRSKSSLEAVYVRPDGLTPSAFPAIDFSHGDPFNSHPDGFSYPRTPTSFAMDSTGRYLFAGTAGTYGYVLRDWVAIVGADGTPLREQFSGDGVGATIAASPTDVLYVSRATVFQGGGKKGTAARVDSSLDNQWVQSFDLPPSALVPLKDSVLVFDGTAQARINTRGVSVPPEGLDGGFVDAVATADDEVDLLTTTAESFSLKHVVYDALMPALLQKGDQCRVNDECAGGRCCFTAASTTGTCAAGATCEFQSNCQMGTECAGGTCYKATPAAVGICTQACTASSTCPTGSYCIAASSACLPDCLAKGDAQCKMLTASLSCAQVSNTENVTISACK